MVHNNNAYLFTHWGPPAVLLVVATILIAPRSSFATPPLRLVSWNVESHGADSATIASQLRELGTFDIIALTEVLPADLTRYEEAIDPTGAQHFRMVHSVTGNDDRLALIFDRRRLTLLDVQELYQVGQTPLNDPEFHHRSPLVARFRVHDPKFDLLVMVNHLARGNAELRQQQARGLREWASRQSLPILALGDYNFDFDFHTQRGNLAFDEFLKDGTWQWLKPQPLVDTNWYDEDRDGKDDYPDSLLDFAFAAGSARDWQVTCQVIVRDGDFPDSDMTSDHRPVQLTVVPSDTVESPVPRDSPAPQSASPQSDAVDP